MRNMREMVQTAKGKSEVLLAAMQRRPIGRGEDEREEASMGQWKREDWRRRCEHCGTLIPDSADLRKRFCNRQCKSLGYTALVRRERAKARAKLKCRYCGKFMRAKHSGRKYCSLRCEWRADYWRNVEKKRERNRTYYHRRAALLASLLADSRAARPT
jgi:hypothetical protein